MKQDATQRPIRIEARRVRRAPGEMIATTTRPVTRSGSSKARRKYATNVKAAASCTPAALAGVLCRSDRDPSVADAAVYQPANARHGTMSCVKDRWRFQHDAETTGSTRGQARHDGDDAALPPRQRRLHDLAPSGRERGRRRPERERS